MQVSQSTLILGAVVLAAGAFALGRETAPSDAHIVEVERAVQPEDPAPEGTAPAMPGTPGVHASPAGMGMGAGTGTADLAADDEPAAIEWTIPAAWHTMPNPSTMRLATYAVPRAPGDSADAEVSVARAGGDTASNIERWTGQFAGADPPRPSVHSVHGLEVTVVEIHGVYTNGMAPGAKPQPGWALLAAIVKTPGMPYFFKMTGPAATVQAARGAFTTMIDGIHPAGG
jgi:3-hydroxymyristoyl/3-hydroxydecanoyl-(acyl carrier protein) dehydratase